MENNTNGTYTIVDVDVNIPERLAREKGTFRCQVANAITSFGMEYCGYLYCIEPIYFSCVLMSSENSYIGRQKTTHACTLVNEAVEVDICAIGSYCID